MKHVMHIMAISAVPAFIVLSFRHPAVVPYIDAGTGSIIIQVLIGFFAAALVLLKIYWNKVKDFFKARFGRGKKSGDIPE